MSNETARRRSIKRLLDQIGKDILHIEKYTVACTRDQFAQNTLVRDAVEQCLGRIVASLRTIADLDQSAHVQLLLSTTLLNSINGRRSVDRMDSDVLLSLVELCRVWLKPEIRSLSAKNSSD